jgi:hypothetical protein
MRADKFSSAVTLTFALLASTAFAQTVSAQTGSEQTAPASSAAMANIADAPATTIAPMAVGASPASGTPPAPGILSVALPPYARLRFDMDVRDDDMLGVIKSFFRGFNGQSLKELLNWMKSSGGATGSAAGTDRGVSANLARDLDKVAMVQLLSDADLGTMLRDISHMRVVVFEMPPTARRPSAPQGTAGSDSANRPVPQTVVAYYEQRYLVGEGGRRIMRGDFDEVQMFTVGFPQRGFAMVFQAPGIGVVVRADGYPNFEGIGPFVMATLLRFTPPNRPKPRPSDSMDLIQPKP